MKEYVAETGGRYTYADDLLSLQELALSMTALLGECSDMILSGCQVTNDGISAGYLWLGGKVRRFEGCANPTFPYYICEHNLTESVAYAGQVNKRGRVSYMAIGVSSVPSVPDTVTGSLPRYIEISQVYAPRLQDKFFGKYTVLLEPLRAQVVKKDLSVVGKLSVDKELESKTGVVISGTDGYSLRQKINSGGIASLGLYKDSALLCEINLEADGTLSFSQGGIVVASMNKFGLKLDQGRFASIRVGSLAMSGDQIFNASESNDRGTVKINYEGVNQGVAHFRNFEVYDGKRCTVPLLKIEGDTRTITVDGLFCISHVTQGIVLRHSFVKNDVRLTGTLAWRDINNEEIALIGFDAADNLDLSLFNGIGNIIFRPKTSVDVRGALLMNGKDITSIYVSQDTFVDSLAKKVNAVIGKGLSSEDFTIELKEKLTAIATSAVSSGGKGYVTASDVKTALEGKLSKTNNLSDLSDAVVARGNLDVHSRAEAGRLFLTVTGGLQELVSLTADEVNGLTADEAAALKARKQTAVRDMIDAEKKGTGDKKLSKDRNLSDLPDIVLARRNMSIYSSSEVDKLLAGKLGTDSAYTGEVFTPELKSKLETIKSGNFNYTDAEGTSHAQIEGYVSTSHVVRELTKKAPLLMDGYDIAQRQKIASNLGIYTQEVSNGRFATLENLFQDYIAYLVKQGKTTPQAQQILREKFDVFSTKEVTDAYLRRDGRFTDLLLPNADAKKQACNVLGAAYAEEYQPRLADTGWMQMLNSGNSTDTSQLFVRQIGATVSIQGRINTAKRDGSNEGGTLAVLPNVIQSPRYGLRTSLADFNDDHKFNRGASFLIQGGSRKLTINESGWYNIWTEINFTYFA